MATAEYDLGYLRAGVAQLESYLLSKELYWPLRANQPSGEPAFPHLTIGGLLLARARAHAWTLDAQQSAELTRLDEQMDAIRNQWLSAWRRKAGMGFHARLNLWRNFLEDYRQHPGDNQDRYVYEVRRRVMLQFLHSEALDLPQVEVDLLAGLDQLLNAVFIPGNFIWEQELQSGFPSQPFWYLYGRLKGD